MATYLLISISYILIKKITIIIERIQTHSLVFSGQYFNTISSHSINRIQNLCQSFYSDLEQQQQLSAAPPHRFIKQLLPPLVQQQ